MPPALALLAVAALRLRRDAGAGEAAPAHRVLAPGLALGLLPSVVACQDGPPLRPAALLVVAAGLVAPRRARPRPCRPRWSPPCSARAR